MMLLILCNVSYAIDFNNVSHINRIPIENISDINNISLSWQPSDPVEDYTEAFYVTEDSDGTGSGTSDDPWSREEFNDLSFGSVDAADGRVGPGDIVYFSGELTGPVIPPGDGVADGFITIDGCVDSDNIYPNEGDNTASFAYFDGVKIPIRISGVNYIIVRDFRIINWTSYTAPANTSGAISVYNSDYIRIRNIDMQDGTSTAYRGVYTNDANHIVVENCRVDGIANSSITNIDSIGIGVVLYNLTDGVVRNCWFDHCLDSVQLNKGSDYLVEGCWFNGKIHTGIPEDHIDVKNWVNGFIIWKNYFESADGVYRGYSGIQIQRGSDNGYVTQNYFEHQPYGVYFYGGCKTEGPFGPTDNHHVWSNIFYDCLGGVYSINSSKGTIGTYYMHNNLFVENVGSTTTSERAAWTPTNGTALARNNVYVDNTTRYGYHRAIYISSDSQVSRINDSNALGYCEGYSTHVFWGNTLGSILFTNASHGTDMTSADPALDSEFKPTSSSTAIIDQGVTISDASLMNYENRLIIDGKSYCNNDGGTCDELISYDVGLSADTDWTTSPPSVVSAKHSDDAFPDLGPYVYAP